MESWSTLTGAILAILIVSYTVASSRTQRCMPPGPKGWPVFGNAFQIPTKLSFLQFDDWAKQYGSIFSLNAMGQRIVVLNDFKSVTDLFERRAHIYSDRPRMVMPERLANGLLVAMMPFNDLLRKMRRAIHEGFNPRAILTYRDIQERSAASLGLKLTQDPDKWTSHIMHAVGSSMVTILFGPQKNEDVRDAMVDKINYFVEKLCTSAAPGHYLVDMFPVLDYLPRALAPWKREAQAFYDDYTGALVGYLDNVRKSMDQGKDETCFAAYLLRDAEKNGLSRIESAWLSAMIFGAGVDTSAGTVMNFIMAMILYPEAMKHGQKLIDTAVGRDRVPTSNDVENLPYFTALVKETVRWRVTAPMGVPRRTAQDDWYKGYFIPKGSVIIPNSWTMNRDPDYFPDYDVFRPGRYLDVEGELNDLIPDTHGLGHLSFGAGKRICPGKDLALQNLPIYFAVLLWAFDFEKAVDDEGNTITPSSMKLIDHAIVVLPEHFKCKIRPRFPEVEQIFKMAAIANV